MDTTNGPKAQLMREVTKAEVSMIEREDTKSMMGMEEATE